MSQVANSAAIARTSSAVKPILCRTSPVCSPDGKWVAFSFKETDARLIMQHEDEPEQALDLKDGHTVALAEGDYRIRVAVPRPGRMLAPASAAMAFGLGAACTPRRSSAVWAWG